MPLPLVKHSQGYMLSQALPAFSAIGQSGLKWHKNGLLEKKVHRVPRDRHRDRKRGSASIWLYHPSCFPIKGSVM